MEPGDVPGDFVIPISLYFDVRYKEYNRMFTDRFNRDLQNESIVNYTYTVWPTGDHQLMADAVESGLVFADAAMDEAQAADVGRTKPTAVNGLRLMPTWPNPAIGGTTISFRAPIRLRSAEIIILDVSGREVRRLPLGDLAPGAHEIAWDAMASHGGAVPAGLYLYRILHAGGQSDAGRVVVVN